jgi:DNA-directed RNA polymerase, mitochondrial
MRHADKARTERNRDMHEDTASASMVEIQRLMEAQDLQAGASRYIVAQERKAERQGDDHRDEVKKIIRGAIPILSAALDEFLVKQAASKGRPSTATKALKAIGDMDTVSHIALALAFSRAFKGQPSRALAEKMGRQIEIELEAMALSEADPEAFQKISALATKGLTPEGMERIHDEAAGETGVRLEWTPREKALIGGTITNVLLIALEGLFEQRKVKIEGQYYTCVILTEEAAKELEGMQDELAWSRPFMRPMTVPPRRWERMDTGAYIDPRLSKHVPMVRTFNKHHKRLIREAIKDGSMQPVLDALNGMQETRFAIDTRVLEVIEWVQGEKKQPGSSFPLLDKPLPPPRIEPEVWAGLAPETQHAKTRERKTIRNIRAASKNNSVGLAVDLGEARALSIIEAFYLPVSMDSRGRVYAVPHFNPQRSDHIKGLFRFADGVPMGAHGGYWLSVHLANCGDFKNAAGQKASKLPMAQRIHWVQENEHLILAAAADPKATYDWWSAADSPFCFLQACFEYAEWHASGFSPDWLGHIAVALDGSCSGLQHYSALNRAEDEGYHVNLLPRDTVGDIYNVVRDHAAPGLEALAKGGDVTCGLIVAAGFDRGTLKRNTMTYFYGSAQNGMAQQHMDDLMRPLADKVALGTISAHPYAQMVETVDEETGEVTERNDGGFTCANQLAKSAYHAITSVAPKADLAAKWFQGIAGILANEGLSTVWKTPMGMPVVQRYSEYHTKVVNMWLYDRKVKVPEATSTDKVEDGRVMTRITAKFREAPKATIDKRKARSAIAPNVIHSLDAAHLQRAVLYALKAGMRHFLMIHDSFATHAGRTAEFSHIIRKAFRDQYDDFCPFEALREGARQQGLSEEGWEKVDKLERPQRGKLDLNEVLGALYAFA